VLHSPEFWHAVLGTIVMGILNVGVSFRLAAGLALRSRQMRHEQARKRASRGRAARSGESPAAARPAPARVIRDRDIVRPRRARCCRQTTPGRGGVAISSAARARPVKIFVAYSESTAKNR
jgi:hypothetical protein